MINFTKRLLKQKGQVMYFCLVLVFAVSPLLSQAVETKELDQILRQELGDSKSKPAETNNSNAAPKFEGSPNKANTGEANKASEETNLIQERYAENPDDSPSATWILLKILFILSILVGAGYFLILQMQKTKSAKYPVKGFMKVLSSLSLSATQSVQIVEVGGRTLVLGVADGSVSLLTEVTAPDEKSQIQKMKEEADPYVPNFLESVLESLQSKAQRKIRINPSKMESLEFDGAAEIQRKAKEGLERLRKHRELLEGGES
ncbi:flagellar biosynthesis protein FliO [Leptospira wolbachii serovar Codice str. CDC]|uniref:Flagellar biosynthesis protein FliO n=2 Tax=Leptospira TaxID=171 RepID=R9A882_9LEPT|nr:flagellar biosynthesis protein FliO [Leptospira wolbachii serovar Codice str. CDC]